jgi:hypothetical protein
MFSKRQISNIQSIIQERVDALANVLVDYHKADKVVQLDIGFTAFSGDIIGEFAFAKKFAAIESPNFVDTFHEAFRAAVQGSHIAVHLPWVFPLMKSLPDSVVAKMNPPMTKLLNLQKVRSNDSSSSLRFPPTRPKPPSMLILSTSFRNLKNRSRTSSTRKTPTSNLTTPPSSTKCSKATFPRKKNPPSA